MEEEFQESEVMFAAADKHDYRIMPSQASGHSHHKSGKKKKKSNSVPVNIPHACAVVSTTTTTAAAAAAYGDSSDESQEDFDFFEDEEMVPPHVITGRRVAGKMAFSVRTGNGRTLKGRDLSQVRNSILRLTGFLET